MNLLNWIRGEKKPQKITTKMFPNPVRQDNGFYPRALPHSENGSGYRSNEDNVSPILTGMMLGEALSGDNSGNSLPDISVDNSPQFDGMGGGDFGGGGSGGSYDTPDTSSTSFDSGASFDSGSSNSDY